ncbi:MAG: hypothetical protein ACRDLT_05080 [Solirubrobacteraceae bacterium]
MVLLRRDDGPSWVARVFGPQRSRSVVEGDAAVLRWLASTISERVRTLVRG